ncbi:hypothetical protein ACFO6S_05225 [Rhodococcus kronopolitis]|uniref:Uncharacterized protein n=1 Tax=Rhodococcus kronopolitis TaxID=1460226 RepID=A0ABV9FMT6_9NOCA
MNIVRGGVQTRSTTGVTTIQTRAAIAIRVPQRSQVARRPASGGVGVGSLGGPGHGAGGHPGGGDCGRERSAGGGG